MNRRQAISRVALILGGTITGAHLFLEGCAPADKKTTSYATFTQDETAYLDEIAETIIPATDTPGAKAAGVGAFMTVMVKDTYVEEDQKTFRDGMEQINDRADKKFDKKFMALMPQQRHELLVEIDNEQKKATEENKDQKHYFRLMKELTLLGYFTSEIGATQALRYIESPGRYEGCIPYKKGDRAWAL